jgi:L-lactate utilization protein LutB
MNRKSVRTQRELADALHALRLFVREVGGNYIAALQAEVAHVEQTLRTTENPNHRQMKSMLKAIAELKVKPQKVRRRDIKELDRLVSRLSDTVDTW